MADFVALLKEKELRALEVNPTEVRSTGDVAESLLDERRVRLHILHVVREPGDLLLAVDARTLEHDVHGPDLGGIVGGAAVVEAAEEDDGVSAVELGTDELVPVRRSVVAPQVGAWDDLCGAVLDGGGTRRHHEADEEVVAHDIGVRLDVRSMVVLVVPVDALGLGARADCHCHRHGEQRVRRVSGGLVVVVVGRRAGQEMLAHLLVQRVAEELLPDRPGPANETKAAFGLWREELPLPRLVCVKVRLHFLQRPGQVVGAGEVLHDNEAVLLEGLHEGLDGLLDVNSLYHSKWRGGDLGGDSSNIRSNSRSGTSSQK